MSPGSHNSAPEPPKGIIYASGGSRVSSDTSAAAIQHSAADQPDSPRNVVSVQFPRRRAQVSSGMGSPRGVPGQRWFADYRPRSRRHRSNSAIASASDGTSSSPGSGFIHSSTNRARPSSMSSRLARCVFRSKPNTDSAFSGMRTQPRVCPGTTQAPKAKVSAADAALLFGSDGEQP